MAAEIKKLINLHSSGKYQMHKKVHDFCYNSIFYGLFKIGQSIFWICLFLIILFLYFVVVVPFVFIFCCGEILFDSSRRTRTQSGDTQRQ